MAAVITDKGVTLLSRLVLGLPLNITRARVGSGTVDASSLEQQTGLTGRIREITINGKSSPKPGTCTLILSVSNGMFPSSYTIKQIGIYANDPLQGEILFSIWQADSGTGINIPAPQVVPGYNAELRYTIQYDQADIINVTLDPSNTVSQAAMEAYVNAAIPKSLPANGGNADTVGGKGVDDFAPSDHTHNYAGSDTPGGSATKANKFAHPVSIRVDLGKTEDVTFDGSEAFTPGVTGTLPIANGGTGASSVEQAQAYLGIITKAVLPNLFVWGRYSVRTTGEISEPNSLISYVVDNRPDTYPNNGKHTDDWYYICYGQLGERPYTYGTEDLEAGVSPLETGKLYFVYE